MKNHVDFSQPPKNNLPKFEDEADIMEFSSNLIITNHFCLVVLIISYICALI